MSIGDVLDIVGAALLLAGAMFCLAAAVGVLRFPDVLTRLHAATKPQVFGLLLILTGVAFTLRTWHVVIWVTLVIGLQILTSPVAGHMLARTAYRTDQWDDEHATIDELGDDLAAAGFRNKAEPGSEH